MFSLKKFVLLCFVFVSIFSFSTGMASANILTDIFSGVQGYATVCGKVTDNQNEPLEGAVVSFSGDGLGTSASAKTNAEGDYSFRVPVKTSGTLTVRLADFRTVRNAYNVYDFSKTGEQYVHNFQLHPDWVSGKVLDAAGNPLVGAKVSVQQDGQVNGTQNLYTDENGDYRAKIAKDGVYYWLTISQDGYTTLRTHIWLSGGNVNNFTLR